MTTHSIEATATQRETRMVQTSRLLLAAARMAETDTSIAYLAADILDLQAEADRWLARHRASYGQRIPDRDPVT